MGWSGDEGMGEKWKERWRRGERVKREKGEMGEGRDVGGNLEVKRKMRMDIGGE